VHGAIRNKTPIELIQSISGTRPTLIDPLRTAQPSTPTEWDRSSSPSRSACSWDNSFCPANGIHGSGSSAGTNLDCLSRIARNVDADQQAALTPLLRCFDGGAVDNRPCLLHLICRFAARFGGPLEIFGLNAIAAYLI